MLLFIFLCDRYNPADIYLLKVKNKNTKAKYKICLKLTIKILERCKLRRSGVFIANLEHISHLTLVFELLTLNMQLPTGYKRTSRQY